MDYAHEENVLGWYKNSSSLNQEESFEVLKLIGFKVKIIITLPFGGTVTIPFEKDNSYLKINQKVTHKAKAPMKFLGKKWLLFYLYKNSYA